MIFWLMLIIFIFGFVIAFIGVEKCWGAIEIVGEVFSFIAALAASVMLIIIVFNYMGTKATVVKKEAEYNAIVYNLESGSCRDEFGLLNKEIIDEVHQWNEEISYKKAIQNDFWLGIFYPDIYDQFELITLE